MWRVSITVNFARCFSSSDSLHTSHMHLTHTEPPPPSTTASCSWGSIQSNLPLYAASIMHCIPLLQPGSWGRFAGLSVLRTGVDVLMSMGINIIRWGGTVSQTFRWKDWRGPPTERPSLGHKWGASLVSGWGLFEVCVLYLVVL